MGAYLDIRTSLERFCIKFSHENFTSGVGTSFPTTGLFVGQTFCRSDLDAIYKLVNLTPTWQLLDYDHFLFDFDAHAQELQFPVGDFIGVRDVSIVTEGKNFITSCSFGVSILNDANLRKHNIMIDKLFSELYPMKSHPIYKVSGGEGDTVYDSLIAMDGVEILPVAKSNARLIQFIGAFFGTGLTAK